MTELRGIIRIVGTDLKGERKLYVSLQKIKGVGHSISNAVCTISGLSREKIVGTLTDQEVKKIEDILNNLKKYDIPEWVLNRKIDSLTGESGHIIGHNVKFIQSQDIKNMMKMKSYKGIRHSYSLPVRGQRTKSSFRKGKTVGVVRKKQQPAKKKGG